MKASLAIIILNYGTAKMTIDLARSILDQDASDVVRLCITLVDNLSLDSSHKELQKFVNQNQSDGYDLKFIQTGKNGGFSFGINAGLSENKSSDYFLLLNSDAQIDIDSIESMIKCAKDNEDKAIISPRILDEKNNVLPSRFGQIGIGSEFLRTAQVSLLERLISNSKLVKQEASEEFYWVSFACALIPSSVLNTVGMLDEGYFMYFEDAEYCARALDHGFKLVYDPNASAVHLRGGSSTLRKDEVELKRMPSFYYRSRSRYLLQRGGRLNCLWANLGWYGGSLIAVTKRILGRGGGLNQLAWLDIWKGFTFSYSQVTPKGTESLSGIDFLIIGAMKSATSTLYEQLRMQSGIYLPENKEPNFFGDDDNFSRGLSWYSNLFEEASDTDIRGEASTDYAKFPAYPMAPERIHSLLPECKIIYIIRHPVDRLISHYVHEWTQGNTGQAIDDAILSDDLFINVSLYSQQLKRYLEYFGEKGVHVIFFERLVNFPDEELHGLSRFLGGSLNLKWKKDRSVANKSSERIKRFPGYGVLIESKLATALRRTLVPEFLRSKIKSRYRMLDRPKLSDATQQYIEQVFDQDLRKLGGMIGTDLNLKNYNTKAKDSPGLTVFKKP